MTNLVLGCQRWSKEVMISVTDQTKIKKGRPEEVYDIFLTKKQAKHLRDSLINILGGD